MKTESEFCAPLVGKKLQITRDAAYSIHCQRAARNVAARSKIVPLPISHDCDNLVSRIYGRAKNHDGVVATIESSYRRDNNQGRYYSRCNYTHYTYNACVQSFARIVGRHLLYTIDTDSGIRHGKFVAPRGYRCELDASGNLIIIGAVGELHLDSQIVLDGAKLAVQKLRDNAARRKLLAKIGKERARDTARTWITPLDAKIAGNCAAGIREFAGQIGANLDNPYLAVPAAIALRGAKNEFQRERVEKTIQIAFARETCIAI